MNKVKKNPHYVNNKDFHDALVAYNMRIDVAKENGTPLPRISNYLGECFLKIATHLSYRPNFVNYMLIYE